jgi:hypothetical protein
MKELIIYSIVFIAAVIMWIYMMFCFGVALFCNEGGL